MNFPDLIGILFIGMILFVLPWGSASFFGLTMLGNSSLKQILGRRVVALVALCALFSILAYGTYAWLQTTVAYTFYSCSAQGHVWEGNRIIDTTCIPGSEIVETHGADVRSQVMADASIPTQFQKACTATPAEICDVALEISQLYGVRWIYSLILASISVTSTMIGGAIALRRIQPGQLGDGEDSQSPISTD